MPIGATGPNNAAFYPSHHSTAAKWPTDRWTDADNVFFKLNERLGDLGEVADRVRRVDPDAVREAIAAHLAGLQLQRQLQSVRALPDSVLLQEGDLPPGPQRDAVTGRAEAYEKANGQLSEAIDQLEYALQRAMDDKLNPDYTTKGQAQFHPNEAIFDLRSYLRTGQPPASLGGPPAPKPPLGTGAVIPQLQTLQNQLKEADELFVELATEKLPRLVVFAAASKGARLQQVQALDAEFKSAAQLRVELPRLEDVSTPLPARDLAAMGARINDYSAAANGAWTRERALGADMLNHARHETWAPPFGQDKATQALDALAQRAVRQAPRNGSSSGSESLQFTERSYAVSQALRDMPPEHGSDLAHKLWLMDFTHRALLENHELKQRCPNGARVGSPYAETVCNVIHSDLLDLELAVSRREGSL